jgi:hypothetical protein
VGANGTILRTTDGGSTWKEQSSGTSELLKGVCFTDAHTGIIVGDHGIILRTTDGGGITDINTKNPEFPCRLALEQNYPNPFNPSTTIRYQLIAAGYVSLKVFDMNGRAVAVLVNERKPAGSFQVEWNAAGFPSGVYFCRLQAGGFFETKKLILIK